MGSRTGNVITAEDLIGQIKGLVEEKIKDRDLTPEEKKDITEKVAISALKYSILKQSIGKDIVYDFDKSISFEGDSDYEGKELHDNIANLIFTEKTP